MACTYGDDMALTFNINSMGSTFMRDLRAYITTESRRTLSHAPSGTQVDETEFVLFDKLIDLINQYDILVGVPEERSQRQIVPNKPIITNAELVYIHTHGVDVREIRYNRAMFQRLGYDFLDARDTARQMYIMSHGSVGYHIPPRPIIEPAIAAHEDIIADKLQDIAKSFLDFNFKEGERKMEATGIYAQNIVKNWFTDPRNGWPPLSPYTIKMKNGKEQPLIDTGQLRRAITYVIKKPEDDLISIIKDAYDSYQVNNTSGTTFAQALVQISNMLRE